MASTARGLGVDFESEDDTLCWTNLFWKSKRLRVSCSSFPGLRSAQLIDHPNTRWLAHQTKERRGRRRPEAAKAIVFVRTPSIRPLSTTSPATRYLDCSISWMSLGMRQHYSTIEPQKLVPFQEITGIICIPRNRTHYAIPTARFGTRQPYSALRCENGLS